MAGVKAHAGHGLGLHLFFGGVKSGKSTVKIEEDPLLSPLRPSEAHFNMAASMAVQQGSRIIRILRHAAVSAVSTSVNLLFPKRCVGCDVEGRVLVQRVQRRLVAPGTSLLLHLFSAGVI